MPVRKLGKKLLMSGRVSGIASLNKKVQALLQAGLEVLVVASNLQLHAAGV